MPLEITTVTKCTLVNDDTLGICLLCSRDYPDLLHYVVCLICCSVQYT